ncbi:hypothetical protein ACHAPU_009049 [Fusarium lateritium]
MKETAKAIRQVQNTASHPVDNHARKLKNIAALDAAWTVNGWIPPFIKLRDREPVTLDNVSYHDVLYLCSITKLACSKGIDLPSLYRPGGMIHGVFTAKQAYAKAKRFWAYMPTLQQGPAVAGPALQNPPFDTEIPEDRRSGLSQSVDTTFGDSLTGDHKEQLRIARAGKRKFGDVSSNYDSHTKARDQLTKKLELTDDTFELLGGLIKKQALGQYNNTKYIPLTFSTPSRSSLTAPSFHTLRPSSALAMHWSIARFDIDKRLLQWYDPLPGAQEHGARDLRTLFDPAGKPFTFARVESALNLSFDHPNAFLLSLLPQEMPGLGRSSTPSLPAKRTRKEVESISVPYDEMDQCIAEWTSTVDYDLESESRESEDSLSSALMLEMKKLDDLEAELSKLGGWIQDPSRQNNEDTAALETRLEALPGLVDEARQVVSQTRAKLVRERKILALRERLMGMVHVPDRGLQRAEDGPST